MAYCEATATAGASAGAEALPFVDAIKEKIGALFGGKGDQGAINGFDMILVHLTRVCQPPPPHSCRVVRSTSPPY